MICSESLRLRFNIAITISKMDQDTLTTFFKWCTILNGSLLLHWSTLLAFTPISYLIFNIVGF